MKCSFCKKEIEKGTGKIFVKNDGKIFYFCSNKCDKNMLKLKRKPAKTKWATKKKKVSKK
ncbi:50S ribosomal protein L24e [Candidatus Woesearchaeota archaeon]|nr:50S ribosomal protein L24e [Candidatus Woesearchaeota archaeon]MBW3005820.1 50S ribosomal protein L24e [Candidatus Woesearchaeota archaeon]